MFQEFLGNAEVGITIPILLLAGRRALQKKLGALTICVQFKRIFSPNYLPKFENEMSDADFGYDQLQGLAIFTL